MSTRINDTTDLRAISRKRDVRRKTIPALAQAGPVSVWMILFVTLPMLYIIYISFMSRGVFGDVVYEFSLESYQTLLDSIYEEPLFPQEMLDEFMAQKLDAHRTR